MPRHQPVYIDGTFYAQIEPRYRTYGPRDDAGNRILESARIVNVTQTRPEKPKPGVVVVKLTVRVPTAAFLPLAPEAVVVVPANFTERVPIEVTARDPHDYGHARDGSDCAPEVCGAASYDPCTYTRAEIATIEAEENQP